MTKDTGDLTQFNTVACREHTLPREAASQPRGWSQGNTRIGPVLEITTSYLYGKHGIEVRIWSLSKDNSQSWVRISYGTIKYVSIQIKTIQKFLQIHKKIKCHKQVSRLLQPDQRQKQNHNRENLLRQQLPYRCTKEDGLTLNHQNKILIRTISRRKLSIFFDTNKQYSEKKDGAIEFYRIKFYLRNHHSHIHNWSDDRWKSCLATGGGSKRRYQYCSDNSGRILYLSALQGHSGNNLIDPTLQDNVVIGSGIFHYIYHIGCAFNLHSIINN